MPNTENRCSCCNHEVAADEYDVVSGRIVCDDCRYTCEECGEQVGEDNVVVVLDILFCSYDCIHNYGFRECVDCDTYFHYEREGLNTPNGSVCGRCGEYYGYCDGCHEYHHQDRMQYTDDDSRYYCNDCYSENDRQRLIFNYSYKPNPMFTKLSYENTTYLGLEIEVECGELDRNRIAEKLRKWLNDRDIGQYVYFKDDGSLRNGIELVFHPFTLKALHKKFPLRKFMAKVKDLGCRGYSAGNAGFHIHLSKESFKGNKNIHKAKAFFYKCSKSLKKFSRRKDFGYCRFDTFLNMSNITNENGRYSALNTTNTHTVEVRIFRSTTSYNRILASIHFSDCLVGYVRSVSWQFLVNNTGEIIWNDFLQYVKRFGYCHLYKYLKGNRICA